ncbi:protein NO VEIN domain-containing protein [Actinomadura namibiensis]|uniref:Protein NO VEIN C-terminal domain-containing protein n=1 Tax=Actinomadura namibiensis TaxID=182080 RepID=A0A7W3QJY6_ACTNM|nr:DUF3883 domain-containing protein [Actinomadura namibiensis]MBA8949934.1 hypothetical protein [Actinomadura namibiensis]
MPPEPVLRAAVRWMEKLPVSGRARCQALFTTHAEYSDIGPHQYDAAYMWLQKSGLLQALDTALPAAQRVFHAALLTGRPAWLPDADLLVREPAELPADAVRAAEALGLSDLQAYQEVHAVWGKVDAAERSRLGAAGEAALADLLASSTMARVEHVAAHSDGYGYDIALHAGRCSLHIEVKATVRRNRLVFFLSRREYETMRHDPCWQLVMVRLTDQLEIDAVCSLASAWIAAQVPSDRGLHGRWESCRIEIPPGGAAKGIPRLAPVLRQEAASLLLGK